MNKKKTVLIAAIVLLVVVGAIYWINSKKAPKQIYEVAVMVRSQSNSDPEEDKKTSLKKGDVLVTQKEGHNWSKTESVSYLILKMNLTEEQAQMLTQAKTKEIEFKDLSEEEQKRIEEEKKRAKDEDREYVEEPRQKTLIAREYRVKLDDKKFEGFKAIDLLKDQPYSEEVFDWGIVEKKK